MRVLVVGSGGREHALVRALARSPQRPELLAAPGNVGMEAQARRLALAADDVDGIVAAAAREGIDLVVVGPEAPLVIGLADALAASGHVVFGPSGAAAQLEGSKAFAKRVMEEAGVPTARWAEVHTLEQGLRAVAKVTGATGGAPDFPGVVVKADGLAAGKGVLIADTEADARAALLEVLVERRFGRGVAIVEERLRGEEASLLALCDGVRAVAMAPAQDYKRILDHDRGPNTGGMGSYSPVPGLDDAAVAELVAQVHQPVVDAMRARGTPFHGVLYAGLMLTAHGPRVLEFNVRFGDPETQAILPRLESDLLELLERSTRTGGLDGAELHFSPRFAVTLVLASAGYPVRSSSGDRISGLERVDPAVEITHAGTDRRDGALVTAGGRVLNVTALGDDPREARRAAYAAAEVIEFQGKQLRRDIAARAEERWVAAEDSR